MAGTYSSAGGKIKKQDVRRDVDPAFQEVERWFGTSVATFAALPDATKFVDGSTVYVTSRRARYKAFGGAWTRVGVPDATWQAATEWYIDPTLGSDDASGRSGFPIKTCQELYDRVCAGQVWTCNQVTKIFVLGTIPMSDPLRLDLTDTMNGQVQVYGTPTTVVSGTLTNVTAQSRSTGSGTPSDVTDTARTWAPYVGMRIRTTGATPCVGWIAKDAGSNKVRISNFKAPMALASVLPGTQIISAPSAPVAVDPTIGDGYVVESLPRIDSLNITIKPGFNAGQAAVPIVFKDLDVGGTTTGACHISSISTGCIILFVQCFYGVQANGTQVFVYNSRLPSLSMRAGSLTLVGGLTIGSVAVRNGGRLTCDGDFMNQGGSVLANEGGVLKFNACCAFDAAIGYNIDVDAIPTRTLAGSYGSDLVWGSGNTYGIRCGSKLSYTTKPTITGSTADANVGGTPKAWSAIPFVEPANGSAIVANFV